MVHLPSANCLGIGNSQHEAVHDHPPIGPPQGYSIRHPPNQRRISVKNWHKSLGEIWSMALVITGTIGLFRHIQESLNHVNGKRVTLTRGVHTNLSELRWLSEDLANHPTCIYEVNPPPTVDGYHCASGTMCGRVILLGLNTVTQEMQAQHSTDLPSSEPASPYPIV